MGSFAFGVYTKTITSLINCFSDMSTGNKTELETAFKLLDLDGDGQISRHELKSLIKNFGGEVSKEKIEHFIKQADLDGNGKIDFSEFWELWSSIKGNTEDDLEIRAEFLRYDLDNSGYITKDEMLEVISEFSSRSEEKALIRTGTLLSVHKVVEHIERDFGELNDVDATLEMIDDNGNMEIMIT